MLRSRVRLPGDEPNKETKEAPHVDIEIELEGQQPLPRHGGGRGRSGASSSSSVPPNAFQIILQRIDDLWDVANEHSNSLIAI